MFSVSQVISPDFARSWHEAVAIVQELASQIQPGLGLPGPADLTIDESGALTLGFGDEGSGDQVAALGGLLQSLLDGVEAPQGLRDLAAENAGPSPSHATVESFSQALAFFERPNRANDIRAVAGRLRHFREKSDTELEFERLREKVAHAGEPGAPEKPKAKKTQKKDAKRKPAKLTKAQQVAMVAAVALMVFGTLGYRSGLHRNVSRNVSSVTGGVESGVQGVVSAAFEWFGISKASASEAPEEPVEADADAPGPDRAVRTSGPAADRPSRPARRDAAARTRPAVPETAPPSARVAAPPAGPPPPPAGSTESARTSSAPARTPEPMPNVTPMPEPGAVFTEEHPEVEAPVLVRPQLPKEPAPGDDTGIFDILVDEQGNVSQIKLISPRRRFHDRMLVAAAKAWKFRPATLHGQPVKYRIQIPIILKGMP